MIENILGVEARNRREIAQQLHLHFLVRRTTYSPCFAIMHRLVFRRGSAPQLVRLPAPLSSLPHLRRVQNFNGSTWLCRVHASLLPLPTLLLVHAKAELLSISACPCLSLLCLSLPGSAFLCRAPPSNHCLRCPVELITLSCCLCCLPLLVSIYLGFISMLHSVHV